MPEVAHMFQDVPASPDVAAQVIAASRRAVAPGLVISGLSFSLGDRHACAIIIRRDGIFDLMAVDGGRVVG